MRGFQDITIRTKLIAGFALLVAFIAAMGVYMVLSASSHFKSISELQGRIYPTMDNSRQMKMAVVQVQQWLTDASATGWTDGIDEAEQWSKTFKGASQNLKGLVGMSPELLGKLGEIDKSFVAYHDMGLKMARNYIDNGREAGNLTMKEFDAFAEDINKRVDEIVVINEKKMLSAMEKSKVVSGNMQKVSAISTVVIGVLAIIIALIITRSIVKPIKDVIAMLNDIASGEGDLTKRINSSSKDEIGRMCGLFDLFIGEIHDVVVKISENSTNLVDASEKLSVISVQIASGTEEQSGRAAQVATASHQMSATVIEVAKNTSGASDVAKEANSAAIKGSEIVEQTIKSMNGISETAKESSEVIANLGVRSEEIGNIINVINDIADQTNLLALNAAIEAARAGEQGRGFAVVADEVRSLAEKTTNATKEIGSMIQGMQGDSTKAVKTMEAEVKAVEEGVRLGTEAGESLREIGSDVEKVNVMIEQIATASEEQSVTADQISSDIETVANIIKETAAATKDMAQTGSDVATLAAELQATVNIFKVDRRGKAGPGRQPLKKVESGDNVLDIKSKKAV